jgi:type IX secretion system PorP/SprF family membrane protein
MTITIQKTYLLGVFLLLLINVGVSQQLPQYTQWSHNQLVLNPAHAGIKTCFDVHSIYRYQWLTMEGAPEGGVITMSVPLYAKRKYYLSARHGIGGKIEREKIGQFNTMRLNIAYSGHFNFSKYDRLSLGLYGGMVQAAYDPSKAVIHDPDPVIMNQSVTTSPDATFGAWWNGENYYLGLTLQNLIPTKLGIGSEAKIKMHSYINGGYRFSLQNDFTLITSSIIRIPPKSRVSFDLNLHLDYKNELGAGIGYRNTDAILFFFNFRLADQLMVQYSYDFVTSPLGSKVINAPFNTHEFSISFSTCKPDFTGSTSTEFF